ncbi:MAG: 30S ribosomal protein S9, partial [Deltaproteobacteria bacterium]|nr:30S ribosomal protein S9 [Deltaproteobacteria bacterium]
MAEERYYATGKRKRSVARVWMGPGTGQITINKRPFEQYLVRESDRNLAVEPLKLAELL